MQTPQEHDIRRQLTRIAASGRFKEAGRARRFLAFIVEEALTGNGAELKENIVGIKVFDRPADYDPRLDAIVRVEAGRLRTKLQEYYGQEGASDPVEITLPKGGYAPSFAWRTPSKSNAADTSVSERRVVSTRPSRLFAAVAAGGAIALAAVGVWRVWVAPSIPATRIAVLPFTSYSADPNDKVIAAHSPTKLRPDSYS
jgi:hypothetical protein